MNIHIAPDPSTLGKEAGEKAAGLLRETIVRKGEARVILATGASQFETLGHLVHATGIDWGKVTMFHLDEYLGIDINHPASFRKYLKERFLQLVPPLKEVFLINGNATDPQHEVERLNKLILQGPIDLALMGIGENGHLAFNDPPADFETGSPYLVVDLDEACRMQQVGEGWFDGLEDVPEKAISMSVRQIMKTRHLISSVPDKRKADAVFAALRGMVTPDVPASILQEHPACHMFLDEAAASRL